MKVREAKSFEQLSALFDEFDRYQGWVYRGQGDAGWELVPKIARSRLAREWRSLFEASRAKLSAVLEQNRAIDSLRSKLRKSGVPEIEQAGARNLTTAGETRDQLSALQKLFSNFEDKIIKSLLGIERRALEAFKKHGHQYVKDIPRNDWEWLALGQHHGLSTRLLDWTQNPLAASFFALSELRGNDAAIDSLKCSRVLDVSQPIERLRCVSRFPARLLDDRLIRQEALFLVTAPPFEERQWTLDEDIRLVKIVIPASSREIILRKVVSFGTDRSALFPDLDGLASHASWLAENPRLVSDAIPSFHELVGDTRDELKELLDDQIGQFKRLRSDMEALVSRAGDVQA